MLAEEEVRRTSLPFAPAQERLKVHRLHEPVHRVLIVVNADRRSLFGKTVHELDVLVSPGELWIEQLSVLDERCLTTRTTAPEASEIIELAMRE